jgi:SOS-response transcriptional repressor LexA
MAAQMTPQMDPNTLGEPLGKETISKPLSLATFAVPVKDRSMAPQFEPGREVLIIDPEWTPKPTKLVLARTRNGDLVFRRYREVGLNDDGVMVFELVPANSDFATLHSERDNLTIIGVMAGYTHYEQED